MLNWDLYFSDLVIEISKKSEDPHTKVGCVIVDPDNAVVSTGYNGLARGVHVLPDRLERPRKYKFFEHGERNAIYLAAKRGVTLNRCKLYCGWVPCCDCARAIIQVGIREVIIRERNRAKWEAKENWRESMEATLQMFAEAGVRLLVCDDEGFTKPYS